MKGKSKMDIMVEVDIRDLDNYEETIDRQNEEIKYHKTRVRIAQSERDKLQVKLDALTTMSRQLEEALEREIDENRKLINSWLKLFRELGRYLPKTALNNLIKGEK